MNELCGFSYEQKCEVHGCDPSTREDQKSSLPRVQFSKMEGGGNSQLAHDNTSIAANASRIARVNCVKIILHSAKIVFAGWGIIFSTDRRAHFPLPLLDDIRCVVLIPREVVDCVYHRRK